MYIANADLTSKIDKLCIEKYGYTESILMENACNNAVKRILKSVQQTDKIKIFCGCGNNGGDGFGIARKLYNRGYDVEIFIIGDISKISKASEINLNILKSYKIPITFIDKTNIKRLKPALLKSDIVIDCIFGAGLNRPVKGIYYDVISTINRYKKISEYKIISIDIPSGLNATTGDVMNICIFADITITFEFFKKGFLRYSTEKYTGKIYVEKIDILYKIYNELGVYDQFMDDDFIVDNLILKESYSHKGDFGKTLVFAGSEGYTGAAFITTEACVKSGSGLTTLISTKDVTNIMANKFIESMYHSIDYNKVLKEKLDRKTLSLLGDCDSICFGSGIGVSKSTEKLLQLIIKNSNSPLVIDADGINILSKNNIVKDVENTIVLTPHMGEFSRLINVSINKIEKNRLDYAKEFALENDAILVLKGKNTIVTDGYRSLISPTGNSAMANGGMGDCHVGFISSFISQGYEPFIAASIAVYLHGKCGDEIYKISQTVNARDIINKLPYILKEYYNKFL